MTTIAATRRARLVEYVPWVFRDYMLNQGPSTAIVIVLIGWVTVSAATGLNGGVRASPVPETIANMLLTSIVPTLVFIGSLFATNGIVSNDRKLGYYRFLLAKPVTPTRYYAMVLAVYGLGFLVVCLALAGLWAIMVRPLSAAPLLVVAATMYVAYGGIGFLMSAAFRFDWMSLVSVYVAANVGWTLWGRATGPKHWLLYLLPPVHRTNDVYTVVTRGFSTLPWTSIAWLAGYGLVCFIAGLVVIRKRPFGTG